MRGRVTEASSVISEEKPGMSVCHRAKSASGSDRGPVRVKPKRPCRLQKLGEDHGTVSKEAAAPPQEVEACGLQPARPQGLHFPSPSELTP